MSAEAQRDGEDAKMRTQAPTRRAALAGMILAGAALVIVGVLALAERPARLPTYEVSAWTGEASEVAQGVRADARGLFTVCPTTATEADGVVGLLLADTWSATTPRVGHPGELAHLHGGPVELTEVELADDYYPPVVGRFLDPAVAADAALAETWTGLCGEVAAVIMVAPDAAIEEIDFAP
ncbi:hypothetical protein [Demequina mangrovi]|uniref:Uncharacterized protein n=1 Tax=Demequina mangrovi TaxID=1043493 RepID=A0A1H7AM03_9MICO|nr:hypothetical protein [Demequina mangrovi]SEJ62035.1 hypothetical protein SAMN05421637_2432 [Demequina mangrovi]